MTHRVGIIGLGVMGQRMLAMMDRDDRFSVIAMADQDPAKLQAPGKDHPDAALLADGDALIGRDDLDLIYIATPPTSHVELARRVLDRGLPVLCEKPLAVSLEEAQGLVQHAQDSGLPNAVNFPIASSSVMAILDRAVQSGDLGDLIRVSIRCRFAQWPRGWQQPAGDWLSGPTEGGFVREVGSHFIHLTQHLLGEMAVSSSIVAFPDDQSSESDVVALMTCDGLPVRMTGAVGGNAPELVEWTLYGSEKSYRFRNWRDLQQGTNDNWTDVDLGSTPASTLHMTAISNLISGQPHPLADFEAGLKVQQTIEAILAK